MADTCPRCLRPLDDCGAEEHGYAKLILECREAELEHALATVAARDATIRGQADAHTECRCKCALKLADEDRARVLEDSK